MEKTTLSLQTLPRLKAKGQDLSMATNQIPGTLNPPTANLLRRAKRVMAPEVVSAVGRRCCEGPVGQRSIRNTSREEAQEGGEPFHDLHRGQPKMLVEKMLENRAGSIVFNGVVMLWRGAAKHAMTTREAWHGAHARGSNPGIEAGAEKAKEHAWR